MSKLPAATSPTQFGTKSAFAVLDVDDLESEDEPVQEHVQPSSDTCVSLSHSKHMYSMRASSLEPPKLTKSQMKKLQKQARTEKRKQARAAAKATAAGNSPSATPSLEQSIAHSVVVSDEEVLSSEAEHVPPRSSSEIDHEDAPPTEAITRPHPERNSYPSKAASDST